jgi:hypothetical protein
MTTLLQACCPTVGATRVLLYAVGRETLRCGKRPKALFMSPHLFRVLARDPRNGRLLKWAGDSDPTILDIPVKLNYGFVYPTVGAADGTMVLV